MAETLPQSAGLIEMWSRRSALRRGSENREHQQPSRTGIPHAMGHAVGRHQEVTLRHRQLSTLKEEDTFALEHVIDLVHPDVRVQGVRLTGLEAVQADEQACGLEEGAFTHLVRTPLCVLAGLDDGGMLQRSIDCVLLLLRPGTCLELRAVATASPGLLFHSITICLSLLSSIGN